MRKEKILHEEDVKDVIDAEIDKRGTSGMVPWGLIYGNFTTIGDSGLFLRIDSGDAASGQWKTENVPVFLADNATVSIAAKPAAGIASLTIPYLELAVISADGAHGRVLFNNTPIVITSEGTVDFGSDSGSYGVVGTEVALAGDHIALTVTTPGAYFVCVNFNGPITVT